MWLLKLEKVRSTKNWGKRQGWLLFWTRTPDRVVHIWWWTGSCSWKPGSLTWATWATRICLWAATSGPKLKSCGTCWGNKTVSARRSDAWAVLPQVDCAQASPGGHRRPDRHDNPRVHEETREGPVRGSSGPGSYLHGRVQQPSLRRPADNRQGYWGLK